MTRNEGLSVAKLVTITVVAEIIRRSLVLHFPQVCAKLRLHKAIWRVCDYLFPFSGSIVYLSNEFTYCLQIEQIPVFDFPYYASRIFFSPH